MVLLFVQVTFLSQVLVAMLLLAACARASDSAGRRLLGTGRPTRIAVCTVVNCEKCKVAPALNSGCLAISWLTDLRHLS